MGIGGGHWITSFFGNWWPYREPTEMTFTQSDVDHFVQKLRKVIDEQESTIDTLRAERRELFTVGEVNQHVESVLSRVRGSIDINSAYHSGKKIATQPYLMNDDPL